MLISAADELRTQFVLALDCPATAIPLGEALEAQLTVMANLT